MWDGRSPEPFFFFEKRIESLSLTGDITTDIIAFTIDFILSTERKTIYYHNYQRNTTRTIQFYNQIFVFFFPLSLNYINIPRQLLFYETIDPIIILLSRARSSRVL